MPLTGPYSFEQWYESENNPWVRFILDSYIEAESLITRFPMETYPDQKRLGKRVIGGLPPVTRLPIGPEPSNPFVVPVEDYDEGVYLIEDNFDFHRLFGLNKNGVYANVQEVHVRNYLKARSFANNADLISNDHVTGYQNSVVGLKFRMANPSIYGNRAALRYAATADLSDANLSTIGAVKLERDLQQICNRMGRPTGKGLIMLGSPLGLASLDAQIKYANGAGGFAITRDSFDRKLSMWQDMEIASVGYNAPDSNGNQGTPIILDSQDALGNWPTDALYNTANTNPNTGASGGVFTNFFIVVKDDGNRFGLWQMESPRMINFEPVSGTRLNRVCLDQTLGIWNPDTIAIATYYGVRTNGPTQS